MDRRASSVLAAAVAVAAAGCGSATPSGTTGSTTRAAPAGGSILQGTTSQGQPLKLLSTGVGVELTMRLDLFCRDGSSIKGASIDNKSHPVKPHPDGSFYIAEKGRTPPSTFPGYNAGDYRWAVGGTLHGATANGTVAFRIQFHDTKCKAVKVTWKARRG